MQLQKMVEQLLTAANKNVYASVDDAYTFLFDDNPLLNYNDHNSAWSLNSNILITSWQTKEDGTLIWRVDNTRDLEPKSTVSSFKDKQTNGLHSHNYLEITFVLEGSFEQVINGKHVTFHAGDVYLIDSKTKYNEVLRTTNNTVLFIGFSNSFFTDVMSSTEQTSKRNIFLNSLLNQYRKKNDYVLFHKSGDSTPTRNLLINILEEVGNRQVGSAYLVHGYCARLLDQLIRNYSFSISSHDRTLLDDIVFESIDAYIRDHYRDVTIKELQENFHYSRDYFNRIIQKKTGMTYVKYIQELRLAAAEKEIRYTQKTIEEISIDAGYNNIGYFYKIFKSRFNMTPHEMRQSPIKP